MSVLERVREAEARAAERPTVSEDLRRARERLKGDLVKRLGLATIASMLSSGDVIRARTELRVVLEAILNTADEPVAGLDRETLLRQVVDAPPRGTSASAGWNTAGTRTESACSAARPGGSTSGAASFTRRTRCLTRRSRS